MVESTSRSCSKSDMQTAFLHHDCSDSTYARERHETTIKIDLRTYLNLRDSHNLVISLAIIHISSGFLQELTSRRETLENIGELHCGIYPSRGQLIIPSTQASNNSTIQSTLFIDHIDFIHIQHV
jgi:hypothetical protein